MVYSGSDHYAGVIMKLSVSQQYAIEYADRAAHLGYPEVGYMLLARKDLSAVIIRRQDSNFVQHDEGQTTEFDNSDEVMARWEDQLLPDQSESLREQLDSLDNGQEVRLIQDNASRRYILSSSLEDRYWSRVKQDKVKVNEEAARVSQQVIHTLNRINLTMKEIEKTAGWKEFEREVAGMRRRQQALVGRISQMLHSKMTSLSHWRGVVNPIERLYLDAQGLFHKIETSTKKLDRPSRQHRYDIEKGNVPDFPMHERRQRELALLKARQRQGAWHPLDWVKEKTHMQREQRQKIEELSASNFDLIRNDMKALWKDIYIGILAGCDELVYSNVVHDDRFRRYAPELAAAASDFHRQLHAKGITLPRPGSWDALMIFEQWWQHQGKLFADRAVHLVARSLTKRGLDIDKAQKYAEAIVLESPRKIKTKVITQSELLNVAHQKAIWNERVIKYTKEAAELITSEQIEKMKTAAGEDEQSGVSKKTIIAANKLLVRISQLKKIILAASFSEPEKDKLIKQLYDYAGLLASIQEGLSPEKNIELVRNGITALENVVQKNKEERKHANEQEVKLLLAKIEELRRESSDLSSIAKAQIRSHLNHYERKLHQGNLTTADLQQITTYLREIEDFIEDERQRRPDDEETTSPSDSGIDDREEFRDREKFRSDTIVAAAFIAFLTAAAAITVTPLIIKFLQWLKNRKSPGYKKLGIWLKKMKAKGWKPGKPIPPAEKKELEKIIKGLNPQELNYLKDKLRMLYRTKKWKRTSLVPGE